VLGFRILLLAVCAISALGAIADGKDRQKGFVALFATSGVLFLASWVVTNH
jgi:MFS-type transporter involved in bile tolerance (Atg22 family)